MSLFMSPTLAGKTSKSQLATWAKKTNPVINPAKKDFFKETSFELRKKNSGKRLKNRKNERLNGGILNNKNIPEKTGSSHFILSLFFILPSPI